MSIPGLPVISFPNVLGLLTGDAISLAAGFLRVPWGIYLGFVPVVIADTVVSFDYDQEYRIADFPIEGGQFDSYNKVYQPFRVGLRFTAGGSLIRRQALLDSIGAVISDLNLYNVVTEDAVYLGVNLVSQRYRQTADDGVGLIKVDVVAQQVKSAALPTLGNLIPHPADPSASVQINGGPINPIGPTQAQVNSIPAIDAN
jgi:hypothetical protein